MCKLRTSKFGSFNLKFNLKFDFVTIDSALKEIVLTYHPKIKILLILSSKKKLSGQNGPPLKLLRFSNIDYDESELRFMMNRVRLSVRRRYVN